MRNICLLMFCSILFIQCKKDTKPYEPVQLCSDLSNNIDTVQKYIRGHYIWVEDRYYNATNGLIQYNHPGNVNYTQTAKIFSDTIIISRSGEPPFIRRFKIQKEKEITMFNEDNDPVLVTYDLASGARSVYFRVFLCKEFMGFFSLARGESGVDIIYKRE